MKNRFKLIIGLICAQIWGPELDNAKQEQIEYIIAVLNEVAKAIPRVEQTHSLEEIKEAVAIVNWHMQKFRKVCLALNRGAL
jgi:hypothetical protein